MAQKRQCHNSALHGISWGAGAWEGMRLGAGWCKRSRGQSPLFLGPTESTVDQTEVGGRAAHTWYLLGRCLGPSYSQRRVPCVQ